MFDRFNRDVTRESNNKILQQWKADLSDFRGQSVIEMADGVNTLLNKVKYIGDSRNWGKSDYWETPVEFLTRGGDCEDFAIAKYVSLRALGVPESLLRIAVVKDLEKGIPHAILIVYTEEG
ncbi:MAG: transglutaminase-like cysteine peptidase, partial [Alphaproteobacteria bacterium]|nr:transglutaminase-like cysteine peptidase [Alphaproteobacteria bacterium]